MPIICSTCNNVNDPAPSGDPRNMWIGYHSAWYHRLYWNIKKKFTK